ncbi:hypothetical protein SAMN05444395_101518 [Flavobacterium fryxellicola]|uniref:Lipoprotein n=1 Tax=Flavobacterium fryxellicola TaxID=249352 RepID=A0A168AHV3_9FLAO|nr:hypothetical protein [Flavobacterium fryxellicola]OAB31484.1 hypothetical protein FBFR_01255 [Flavobacterium fryxellicola]SHN53384.1 hypothetical protein SAMN05444395_101518 [Flavobacterium fryxellicola]
MTNKTNTIAQTTNLSRFLMQIASLVLFLFLLSCEKEETIDKVIEQSIELQIENEKFKLENESFVVNENCNTIFVSFIYDRGKNEPHFIFELSITKKGIVRKISYTRFGESTKPFDTPDFNLRGLLSVNNFVYDESTKYLNFDFSGELLEVETNIASLDQPQKRKKINGKIIVNKLKATTCTSFISDLNFKTNTYTFSTNHHAGSHDPNLKVNPYDFRFYSDNGYRAIIKFSKDLWNLDKGTYAFEQNTLENRIDLEKYIGIFRATQLLWVRDIDWKKFQTSGSYTIKEQVMINGLKVTKGEMNLQVYDNGMLLYTVGNGKFEVVGF